LQTGNAEKQTEKRLVESGKIYLDIAPNSDDQRQLVPMCLCLDYCKRKFMLSYPGLEENDREWLPVNCPSYFKRIVDAIWNEWLSSVGIVEKDQ